MKKIETDAILIVLEKLNTIMYIFDLWKKEKTKQNIIEAYEDFVKLSFASLCLCDYYGEQVAYQKYINDAQMQSICQCKNLNYSISLEEINDLNSFCDEFVKENQ
jgi:hypothetical protein